MFVDKFSGKVKWLNVIAAKAGIIGIIAVSTHLGAHYSPYVQNVETTIVHGLRQSEEEHYGGDAHVEVVINQKGNLERHVVLMPCNESYALGDDGYPKEPEDLFLGLENRLESAANPKVILDELRLLEQQYSE